MKKYYFLSLVGLLASVQANEALDVLEGKKDATPGAAVTLPAEDAALIQGATTPAATDGKVIKPYVAPVPSEYSRQSKQSFDPIWARTTIIKNEQNKYVQELSLIGLFEASAAWGDVETTLNGSTSTYRPNDVELRRAQLGARMKAFYRTEITGVAEMAGPSRMSGIKTLKASTVLSDNFGLTLGKFRPLSTLENGIDDSQLLTTERALLSNLIAPADSLGIMLDAKKGDWRFNFGWFSNDFNEMIPGVDNEGFINVGVAYEKTSKTDSGVPLHTRWYLNYIHNMDRNFSEVIPRHELTMNNTYGEIVSTGFTIQQDRLGFQGEFTIAQGDKSVWGMTLTPSYWIMPNTIQLVGRYHFADSDEKDALLTGYGPGADPFFESGPIYSGDEFHSFYLGANVHLYENRMVIYNGLEYTLFKDELDSGAETKSLLWQSGARLSF